MAGGVVIDWNAGDVVIQNGLCLCQQPQALRRVGFIAGAKDVDGASKDAVACGTSGTFESMFADRVKKRLLK